MAGRRSRELCCAHAIGAHSLLRADVALLHIARNLRAWSGPRLAKAAAAGRLKANYVTLTQRQVGELRRQPLPFAISCQVEGARPGGRSAGQAEGRKAEAIQVGRKPCLG